MFKPKRIMFKFYILFNNTKNIINKFYYKLIFTLIYLLNYLKKLYYFDFGTI